jgi:methylmalonyl-CoA epimerase
MIEKITHIGIAVNNIDDQLKIYRDIMGMKVGERVKSPYRGVEVVFIETGDTKLELLQPLDENSNLNKFLQKKGQGIHHICLEVDNIEAALKEYESKGIQLIDKTARPGASGELVAFLHPKSTGGVLIELEQKKE